MDWNDSNVEGLRDRVKRECIFEQVAGITWRRIESAPGWRNWQTLGT